MGQVISKDTARKRLQSIDLLRGLVIVLMALDHTRDFFGASGPNPRDLTDPTVFLTRWVTHFCAPTFILLAGVSAYLYGSHKRSVGQLSWFLFTRGLWLVFIEFTLVRFGWTLTFDLKLFFAGVIWVIGASMIVLAGLVYLPERAVAAIGLTMIAGHDLLDGVRAEHFGNLGWLWNFLHQPALLHIGAQSQFLVAYTLVPWAGVMAMGYALGPVFKLDPSDRRHLLLRGGTAPIAGFVLLRATNLYGDPAPWSVQGTSFGTLLSFINCEKYPPSLLYLMMTLGPALVLLALFEHVHGRIADWLTTFGRVPAQQTWPATLPVPVVSFIIGVRFCIATPQCLASHPRFAQVMRSVWVQFLGSLADCAGWLPRRGPPVWSRLRMGPGDLSCLLIEPPSRNSTRGPARSSTPSLDRAPPPARAMR